MPRRSGRALSDGRTHDDAGARRADPVRGRAGGLRCQAAFARAIVADLAQSYRSVVKNTKDLKLRSSLERLANYLLREQRRAGAAPAFDLPFDKRRLASLLGMTPENLSRAFKSLQAYGVATDGGRIAIGDQADLERFAKPNPLIDDRST